MKTREEKRRTSALHRAARLYASCVFHSASLCYDNSGKEENRWIKAERRERHLAAAKSCTEKV